MGDKELYGNNPGVSELEKYCGLKQVKRMGLDLISFWSAHEGSWPNLSRLACRYHTIPASSAPSERAFSQCNRVLSGERNQLTEENAKMLCLLAANVSSPVLD